MANEKLKNLVEQHVEKAALGLCVLVLAGMYLVYGRDVREITVVGRGGSSASVTPETVDATLQDAAKFVEDRNRKAKAPESNYRDLTQKIVDLQVASRIDSAGAPEARMPGKLLEVSGPIEYAKVALDDLVSKLPRPDKPVVTARYVLPKVDEPKDVIVAHPAAAYNWDELTKYWSAALKDTMARNDLHIAVMGVEAEVQEKQADGNWIAGKAITVSAADGNGLPVTLAKMPAYEPGKTDPAEIRNYQKNFVTKFQEAVVQPGFVPVWDSLGRHWTDWKNDLPASLVGDLGEAATKVDAAPAKGVKPAGSVAIPSVGEQMQKGKLLVWFHDSTLQAGKSYRYRLRLVLANPLLTYTQDVSKPADAAVATVRTPWSDWSDEVCEPRETEFFIVGSDGDRARVKVYVRSMGQRVAHTFYLTQGQAIGGVTSKNILNPISGKLVARDVDFSTGMVAVEVNTAKSIQRGPTTRTTTEILYLDDKGQLKRCLSIADMDKETPERQLYERREKELGSSGRAP